MALLKRLSSTSFTSRPPNQQIRHSSDPRRLASLNSSAAAEILKRKASGRFRVVRSTENLDQNSATKGMRDSFRNISEIDLRNIQSREVLKIIVHSMAFEALCGMMIIASMIVIGVETDVMARHPSESHRGYSIAHMCFNVFFTIELIMRIMVDGTQFFKNRQWRWNLLDTCLVLTAVVELFIAIISGGFTKAVPAIRTIRFVRLIRTMRLIRTLKSVREFQRMVFAIMSSARTLLCSLLILSFVMYFFAIILTQAATEYRLESDADKNAINALEMYFQSLPDSLYSLFLTISNGISWDYIFRALSFDPNYAFIFLIYISIVLFGVLNVVTSVFVESAIMSAQHYKDLIIQEKQHAKEIAMAHMKEVFKQIDEDDSGVITVDEMDFFLKDPSLKKYIEALGISAEDTHMLFRLLDTDGSKEIDINEFCEGCLKLQGFAKSFDVHAMIYQVRQFLDKWSDFTVYVEQKFAVLYTLCGIEFDDPEITDTANPQFQPDEPGILENRRDKEASENGMNSTISAESI